MSTPVETRPLLRPRTSGTRAADTRLSWWTLLLPVAAFVALLLLHAGSGDAAAAAPFPFGGLLEQVDRLRG
ncbi:hypothetical protein LG634_25090 [Streptomyces bambusae]|uniref:hypothetical protein n=1 Tax=Streptomyces bambusae TaxID=1550616 RepID=UPI001CFCF825|nr:hypothetical protein [Streptomyces bambusae]MCB5168091.1 hypothetical protein [Streptomyces bambusae]